MTIGPKIAKPSKADEKLAYQRATERDQSTCVRCRRGGPVQRDHRQNRQVGNTTAANLQCLCETCHLWKTDHTAEANYDGWGCPGWAVPAEWPAHRYLPTAFGLVRLAWVLYDDAGNWVEITAADAAVRMGSAA